MYQLMPAGRIDELKVKMFEECIREELPLFVVHGQVSSETLAWIVVGGIGVVEELALGFEASLGGGTAGPMVLSVTA